MGETLTKAIDIQNEHKAKQAEHFEISEPRRVQSNDRQKKQKLKKYKSCWKMTSGTAVCVLMPLAIYVTDVIITVNVLESSKYKERIHAYINDHDDKDNMPLPKPETFADFNYTLKETLFAELMKASDIHRKRLLDNKAMRAGF